MVARDAGAAGPVLLACRQWEPLGLARRLPSRGAGAWRGAPLLPWRVQCPGRVCAALAAGSGGLGPVPGFVSSPFPPSRPAFPALCVAGRPVRVSLILARWYAIPCVLCVPRARYSCPSGIPRVSFACACACAPTASAPPPPLPGSVWRAHLARSRCWAPVGPFHAVRAPSRVLPRSRALFFLAWGGGSPVLFPPCLAWGCVPSLGRARASGVFRHRGGGGGCVPSSPEVWPGAPRGGGSPYLGPSLCLPWAGKKAGVIGVALVMEGVAVILLRFVFACCPQAWSVWRPCALARIRLPVAAPIGAGRLGLGGAWRTGSAASPPRAPRLFRGEGGRPPSLGGG